MRDRVRGSVEEREREQRPKRPCPPRPSHVARCYLEQSNPISRGWHRLAVRPSLQRFFALSWGSAPGRCKRIRTSNGRVSFTSGDPAQHNLEQAESLILGLNGAREQRQWQTSSAAAKPTLDRVFLFRLAKVGDCGDSGSVSRPALTTVAPSRPTGIMT
jgi:hypothetical protein